MSVKSLTSVQEVPSQCSTVSTAAGGGDTASPPARIKAVAVPIPEAFDRGAFGSRISVHVLPLYSS